MKAADDQFKIILNPIAGNGKALAQLPKIERFLKKAEARFEILTTTKAGDALEIARKSPPEAILVAAGGDGTCNEVINGLLARNQGTPPVFGILPIGRGNDFSSSVGVPEDPETALQILLEKKIRPLDAGLVKGGYFPEGRYFVNGIGIGFDTKVGFEAAKMKGIHSGFSYALGALITVIRFEKAPLLEISYGNETKIIPALIVSIMNGRRMGGSFYMGPDALLDDGALDICMVQQTSGRLKLINIVMHYPKGTQAECEGVFMGRAADIHIKALEGGMAAHVDGETVCVDGKELTINCIAGALRLIGA
jgi:YegS/Rv2252/BmrU family lipid kinase